MKIFDYFCEKCGLLEDMRTNGEQVIKCACGGAAVKMPNAVKSYTWGSGDNSASTTPKKFRKDNIK